MDDDDDAAMRSLRHAAAAEEAARDAIETAVGRALGAAAAREAAEPRLAADWAMSQLRLLMSFVPVSDQPDRPAAEPEPTPGPRDPARNIPSRCNFFVRRVERAWS